jgi:hypothetical protein
LAGSPALGKREQFGPSSTASGDVDGGITVTRHVTEMYLSSAERLVLQSASCRLVVDRDGHEIAVVLNDKTPLLITFTSLLMTVRR